MLLLHLSDFHLSRYGESGIWSRRPEAEEAAWETVHSWHRWQIEGLRDRKGRPDRLRLVDPEGVIHKTKSWPRKDDKLIGALMGCAMKRHETSAERLINNRPTDEDLDTLLHVDPGNSNLRFLKLVEEVNALGPDLLVITGDITDNGFGYDLVTHYFAPWIAEQRLFAIPGNHDTYDMFPRLGRRARTEAKEERYLRFAESIGMAPGESGAYVRRVDDIAVVGLNSCRMPMTPLSASGAVSKEQLSWLAALAKDSEFKHVRLRLILVHHHLLRMPFTIGKRSPFEVGMRLRNAVPVIQAATEARIDMILHGHRHHGYSVQLPGRPTVTSSPSSTLGCKSNGLVYGWRMDVSSQRPVPVMHELLKIPRATSGGPSEGRELDDGEHGSDVEDDES